MSSVTYSTWDRLYCQGRDTQGAGVTPRAAGRDPRPAGCSLGVPGVILSLLSQQHSVLVPDGEQGGTAGSAGPGHFAVSRVPNTCPRDRAHSLLPREAVAAQVRSLPRCHLSCPVTAKVEQLPPRPRRAPRPLCLFLHYFPAPPTLSLPLLLSLAFVPSLLFPPSSQKPSPISNPCSGCPACVN